MDEDDRGTRPVRRALPVRRVRLRQMQVQPADALARALRDVQQESLGAFRLAVRHAVGSVPRRVQPLPLPRRGAEQYAGERLGFGEHRPVAGRQLEEADLRAREPAELRRAVGDQVLQRRDGGAARRAENPAARHRVDAAGQPQRLGQHAAGLRRGERAEAVQVLGGESGGAAPALPPLPLRGRDQRVWLLAQQRVDARVGNQGERRVTVLRDTRVDVHDPGHPLRPPHRRTDHGVNAVVVADQHHGRCVSASHGVERVDQPDHLLDVRVQVALRVGQRSGQHPRTGPAQPGGHLVPHRGAGERAGGKDECRHSETSTSLVRSRTVGTPPDGGSSPRGELATQQVRGIRQTARRYTSGGPYASRTHGGR